MCIRNLIFECCINWARLLQPRRCLEIKHMKLAFIHYTEVIMGAIASQITSFTIVYSTVHSDVDQRKHQSSALPGTGEFPAQMASNAENVSISWRHHVTMRSADMATYRHSNRCIWKCLQWSDEICMLSLGCYFGGYFLVEFNTQMNLNTVLHDIICIISFPIWTIQRIRETENITWTVPKLYVSGKFLNAFPRISTAKLANMTWTHDITRAKQNTSQPCAFYSIYRTHQYSSGGDAWLVVVHCTSLHSLCDACWFSDGPVEVQTWLYQS